MITVFTPSYNRKKELKKLYDSLLKQDYSNFEWLIVDDGSSDDTEEYIKELKKQNKININYVYKENGGKQSAYNMGLKKAKGDIFLCIDSDDILKTNILKKINEDFEKYEDNNKIGGIAYLQGYISDKNKLIGTKFPDDVEIINYFDIYHKYDVKGDKLIVLKTKVAKKYYFPIIEGEKFIPEALIFNRISLKYDFVCINEIAAYKDYLDSGYSNNYFNLVKRNPKGNMLYFKELYSLDKSIYNIYGYILFGIYGKISFRELVREHSAKILVIVMYLPTLIISLLRR